MSQQLSEIIAPQVELAPVDPPPLENGDHLTRCEFERRYSAMPDVKKAELIERSGVYAVTSTCEISWRST